MSILKRAPAESTLIAPQSVSAMLLDMVLVLVSGRVVLSHAAPLDLTRKACPA